MRIVRVDFVVTFGKMENRKFSECSRFFIAFGSLHIVYMAGVDGFGRV